MPLPRLVVGQISVVIADHDVLACKLLASRLRKHRQFHVTECADTTEATVGLMRKVRPSVALISASLPQDPEGGFKVLREIQTWSPRIRGVLLLDSAEEQAVVQAFRCGARGVFMRSAYQFETLRKCVHRVHQGQIWADSKQLGYVMDAFCRSAVLSSFSCNVDVRIISRRERDVVQSVVEGLSNREIAQRLELSEHTVKNYIFRIFDKLGVSSRVELVHYALAHADALKRPEEPADATESGNGKALRRAAS